MTSSKMISMSSSDSLHYYMEHFFKIPADLKNDIAYCQRALKAHVSVHQTVVDIFQNHGVENFPERQRILDELETQIYEINTEQQYLFLQLRRVLEEFYRLLKRNNIMFDTNTTNSIISKRLVPLINDENIEITPIAVEVRATESKLMEKYFEIEKEKPVYEILSSDEERIALIKDNPVEEVHAIEDDDYDDNGTNNNAELNESPCTFGANNPNETQQMSLLKPIAQRLVPNFVATPMDSVMTDASQVVQGNCKDEKQTVGQIPKSDVISKADVSNKTTVHVTNGSSVTMSRSNLRYALIKARVAQAAANNESNAPEILTKRVANATVSSSSSTQAVPAILSTNSGLATVNVAPVLLKKSESKANTKRSMIATKQVENSSSEDSNPERITPPVFWMHDLEETRTQPEDYGQELFLRLFHLFTPEMQAQMQQRRSKRKRRTVYSNERADFHYGRIDYGACDMADQKKGRKAFLLSPQVKRRIQSKRRKRCVAEKNDDATPRSSSSSPDEKRCCNECLKGGGLLDKCKECKGFYHQLCHRETACDGDGNDEKPTSSKRALRQMKLCPACKRSQGKLLKKDVENKVLKDTVKELKGKIAHQKERHNSLKQAGKTYKIQMSQLYNIVNAIKIDDDEETDSVE